MEIETKLISTETIKPSSPTPKSLQKYHLSFLDQRVPPFFNPFVYLYSSNPKFSKSEKSKQLKKSFSEVLSIYYPIAGRLVGNLYANCNDAGVPFSEAEADCDLSQVIGSPNPRILKNFVPHETDEFQDLFMAVRATYFRCGGLAVGILFSHKIADGFSFFTFVKTWSVVARNGGGGGGVPLPVFDIATYAPPLDILSHLQVTLGLVEKSEIAVKIFTFSASEIAALQERYTDTVGGRRPSRVEALSAFIWTRFVSATGIGPGKICVIQSSVNLRSRAEPPLSDYHFGNFLMPLEAEVAAGDSGVELLRKLRGSEALGAGYVARLKNREMQLKEIRGSEARANDGDVVRFFFSSWCRFPLYEADFGWGRPDQTGYAGLPFNNFVFLMDTKSEGGIEAMVHLTKQDMNNFEAHFNIRE